MPWCFNNEGREGQPRWEYCNVPKCSDKGFYLHFFNIEMYQGVLIKVFIG